MEGAIDYAGLFPPAGLDMKTAVRNFAEYRQGQHAWMLGRFVVPVGQLSEFVQAAADFRVPAKTWRLTALPGSDLASDLERLRIVAAQQPALIIESVEIKATNASEIEQATKLAPRSFTKYFEIPIGNDPRELAPALRQRGSRVKVRTGGTSAESIPGTTDLARFITRCVAADVLFKATAGLHHPLRGVHSLTATAGGPSARMHGFLNLMLAATLAVKGADAST